MRKEIQAKIKDIPDCLMAMRLKKKNLVDFLIDFDMVLNR